MCPVQGFLKAHSFPTIIQHNVPHICHVCTCPFLEYWNYDVNIEIHWASGQKSYNRQRYWYTVLSHIIPKQLIDPAGNMRLKDGKWVSHGFPILHLLPKITHFLFLEFRVSSLACMNPPMSRTPSVSVRIRSMYEVQIHLFYIDVTWERTKAFKRY